MTLAEAVRLLGKPNEQDRVVHSTATQPKGKPAPYIEAFWRKGPEDDPLQTLNAVADLQTQRILRLSVSGGVYATAEGISTKTMLSEVRKRYRTVQVRSYYFGTKDEPGYQGFYFDVVAAGMAFAYGTQDAIPPSAMFARMTPSEIVVHPAGKPVLAVESGKVGLGNLYDEKDTDEKAIARWFRTGKF
jgi:hypothetical protein